MLGAVAIITTLAVWNFSESKSVLLSDVGLANVEALADAEVIWGHPCAHICCGVCMYFWWDGSVDEFLGQIYTN
ncbi:MAG: NVEALA domain-containing protein [Tannerellaceae bacterium]|nr:NVEALA domain-containing protein [Tannerellaceae bacterium]